MADSHLKCLHSTVEVNDIKSFQATGHCFIIVAQFASFDSVALGLSSEVTQLAAEAFQFMR